MQTIETVTGGGVLTRGLGGTAVRNEFTDQVITRFLRRWTSGGIEPAVVDPATYRHCPDVQLASGGHTFPKQQDEPFGTQ
jgi:hypothetical protein